jgi:molybdopterin molybdotransferase
VIGFDEALAIVCREARPLGAEVLPLGEAHRRILAEPVIAAVNSPPADVSATHGYAVRTAELDAGRRSFAVAGESFPGAPFTGEVSEGACVRIFTGGPLPTGLDRVVIQENVRREDDTAHVEELSKANHVRLCGSDFREGDTLLEAGRHLDARALIAAAGADQPLLTVYRKPRLALLGTGDELTEPGQARTSKGRLIPESLSPGIAALSAEWGGEAVLHRRLQDDPDLIASAAAEAVEMADVVVTMGGASVGEKDFAKAAFEPLGLDLLFSKVAIKPGKPVWFGRARGALVLGLPGNPTSAMVTARLFLAPLIAGLSGREPMSALQWRSAQLAGGLGPVGDRETFVRGRRAGEEVDPMSNQDSGSQKTLADSNVLIRRASGEGALSAGDAIDVLDL